MNRHRPFLRLGLLLCTFVAATWAAAPAGAPNIVILLADDMGYGDVSSYGGTVVPTPRIDGLARQGVRFTDGYVTCPACAPSRLSLMAGAYPQRFGMTWNDDRGAHRLPDSQRLLPELLRGAGYVTGLVGKWNIVRPAEQVFDEVHHFIEWESDYFPQEDGHYVGSLATKSPGFASSKTQYWGPKREGDEYLTDKLGRHAVEFIDRHAGRPFFLYVGFNAVHSPWQGRRSDEKRFAHLPLEVHRLYASMVAALDENVGRILDALRSRRLEENTLVFFLADNGPAKGGPHIEGWKPEWPRGITVVGSAGPLRGAKTDLYEGGIREPFIVRWPGRVPAGVNYRHPVTAMDVLPTACAAAGVRTPATTIVDGVDLVPFVRGDRAEAPHGDLFWKIKSAAALRRGDWKLLLLAPEFRPQLFHLGRDIGEARDLAGEEPALTRELLDAWQAWNRTMPPPARPTPAAAKKS
ncbi:MAG: sulfatase-like hydrolase/transferase [Verrucomicrobia bacterium]|nr:sulfatase-like hydrolase/transferase [Verrucomicrobiota bacterium]